MSDKPLSTAEITLLGVCVALVLGAVVVVGALGYRIVTGGW